MKIVLHTGMSKTGTTTVQNVLASQTEPLARYGFRAFINPLQIVVNYEQFFDPDWLQVQVKSALDDGLHTLIFSAEIMSTYDAAQLSAIFDVFSKHDIICVTCFRHWPGYLPSRWSQNCLRRDTQSFPEYFKTITSPDYADKTEPHFDNVVRNMELAGADSIKIMSYDNAVAGAGILTECLKAFGFSQAFISKVTSETHWQNKRREALDIEILRLFNGVYARQKGHKPNALFDGLMTGMPVKHLYDFAPKIARILVGCPALKEQLEDAITSQNVKVEFEADDPDLVKWQASLETVSSKYLLNPVQGEFFHNVKTRSFTCSDITIDDLDNALQSHMIEELYKVG